MSDDTMNPAANWLEAENTALREELEQMKQRNIELEAFRKAAGNQAGHDAKRIQELESALASTQDELQHINTTVLPAYDLLKTKLDAQLAAKEEELKALRETPCTYDHIRPLVAMTAERDWENARADRLEQREKRLREALAIAHDVLNPRRFELITKRNMSALTEAEEQELRKLTEFVDCYVDLIAPLPPTPIVEAVLAEGESKC